MHIQKLKLTTIFATHPHTYKELKEELGIPIPNPFPFPVPSDGCYKINTAYYVIVDGEVFIDKSDMFEYYMRNLQLGVDQYPSTITDHLRAIDKLFPSLLSNKQQSLLHAHLHRQGMRKQHYEIHKFFRSFNNANTTENTRS